MPNGELLARWRVPPGRRFRLSTRDPASVEGAPRDRGGDGDDEDGGGGRDETEQASADLNEELSELQERLWAEGQQSLLVVLQAMDGGGKDGTIKKVFTGVNPQGVRVTSFGVPTDEELAHDFLWRIHRATPEHGEIGIFNRSHYEDVLVVRVHGDITPQECRRRYDAINAFEHLLTGAGTRIVKLMLHISQEEQAERMRKRQEDPTKRWKFNPADLEERKLWDDYMRAYQDAISATSTDVAPWYVVPADHKWYRDWAALTILVETLRTMDPQFPA